MGTFDITKARQKLGFTPATAVRTNINVPNLSTGAAVGQAAVAGIRLKQNYDTKVANTELSEYQRNVGFDDVELDADVRAELDPNKHPVIYQKHAEARKQFMPNSKKGKQVAELWNNIQEPKYAETLADGMVERADDNWLAEYSAQVAGIEQGNGRLANTEAYIARRQLGGDPLDKSVAAKLLSEARNANKKGVAENMKPRLIEAINTGGKQAGLELLTSSVKELVNEGVLTENEGAETDKRLGDWMDSYVEGRNKQIKDSKERQTVQSYEGFFPQILDGKLEFDDVEQADMLKVDKEKWLGLEEEEKGYIKGSRKDAPTTNTPKGFNRAFNAIYDVATLQRSKKQAYDILLKERFNKREITDEQFEWAVDKIQNPYPKYIREDLRSVMQSNNSDFNRLLSFDNERNRETNEALIAWVDDLIKRDKVPLFDFKKKMEAMSSQFRVGNDRWYDIGQVITRGEREWEVVGFDEDGEVMVEEIE